MDRDGIETTSPRDGTVILFDHNGDEIKTGTGWLTPDDGWLVLDRNGNGTIDNGRELFGADTVLQDGAIAADGFAALRDQDSNGDSLISASDSVFSNLRIWRDLNQDGISQSNELTTLEQEEILSIGLNATYGNSNLGNGNVQTAVGTFTRSDGTTGGTGTFLSAAANLDLLISTFYSEFVDSVPLTEQAISLPNLHGSGRVRDLYEAISLSPDLGNFVQDYLTQSTRGAQIALLDTFIEKWASTSDLKPLKQQAEDLSAQGVNVSVTYNTNVFIIGTPEYDEFVHKLGVVERFMGFTYGGPRGQARLTPLDENSGNLTVTLGAAQIANIELAYERFKNDIYESFLLVGRLEPYYNLAEIVQIDGEWKADFSLMESAFANAIQTNAREGIIDLVEFISAVGYRHLERMGWNWKQFLSDQLGDHGDLGAFSEGLSDWTIRFASNDPNAAISASPLTLLLSTREDGVLQGLIGDDY